MAVGDGETGDVRTGFRDGNKGKKLRGWVSGTERLGPEGRKRVSVEHCYL